VLHYAGPAAELLFRHALCWRPRGADDIRQLLHDFPDVPCPPGYDRAVRTLLRQVRRRAADFVREHRGEILRVAAGLIAFKVLPAGEVKRAMSLPPTYPRAGSR
jgi:hypothetical protein